MARKTKMNHITDPEKTARINPNNLRLLDDFLIYLRSVQRSSGTIAGYSNDLLIVFTYVLENLNNKDFQNITKRDLISLQNWLVSNGNSSARIRRIKAAISSLSNYCENILADDEPEFAGFRSIVRKVESPPLQAVREKTVLSDEDIQSILDMLVERKKYEVACFVALAAFGGRRKSEICRFKVTDFDDDKLVCGGSLWRSDPMKTKGRGTQGKILNVYTLVKPFRPYLELWMSERKRLGIDSVWLFPDERDPSLQLPISTVNSWMNTLSRIAGKDIYAHSFRHRYTTYLSDNGIPDSVIKEIQGWSDISMVSVYLDRTTESTLDMYFDQDGFKSVQKGRLEDL